jgi:hypothetical protein
VRCRYHDLGSIYSYQSGSWLGDTTDKSACFGIDSISPFWQVWLVTTGLTSFSHTSLGNTTVHLPVFPQQFSWLLIRHEDIVRRARIEGFMPPFFGWYYAWSNTLSVEGGNPPIGLRSSQHNGLLVGNTLVKLVHILWTDSESLSCLTSFGVDKTPTRSALLSVKINPFAYRYRCVTTNTNTTHRAYTYLCCMCDKYGWVETGSAVTPSILVRFPPQNTLRYATPSMSSKTPCYEIFSVAYR